MRQKEKRRRARAIAAIETERMARHFRGECSKTTCQSCGQPFDRCPFESHVAQKQWGQKSLTRCHQCWRKP